MRALLVALVFMGSLATAQPLTVYRTPSVPSGNCTTQNGVRVITASGAIWTCGGTAWVNITGASIAHTTSTLRGDGSGNAVAVTGTATDCVFVNGTSGTCGTGGGSPAGSAITDAQCWASSSTFGVCVSEIWTTSAAPSSPSAGTGHLYIDSTSKNFAVKDDAGLVKHGIQDATCTNQVISAVSAAGLSTCHTVVAADTSGLVPTTRNVNTTSPITGGGDLSADRTIACATCLTANQAITLSGDTAGSGTTAITTTTSKVNGVSSPASPANHTVQVVTASNTRTDKVVPDCIDTGGNHLNFTQSTDAFSCGTSGGGGGGGANITSGTYASIPGTCTHTSTQSDIYMMTDAPYQAVCTSTNTWSYFLQGAGGFGQVYPPALLGSWTWDNQGSSTIDATHGFFSMKIVATGGTTAAVYYRAKTAPYTITALIDITGLRGATGYGLTFRDGTGKLVSEYFQYAGGGIFEQNWTSTVSFSGNVTSNGDYGPFASRPYWYRIQDDNTNFIVSVSQDNQNWVQINSSSRTAFTAGSTGAGVFFYNSGGMLANVLSWQEQ